MFVPFITKRSKRNLSSSSSNETRDLHRRKGGGGGGRGGGGRGGSSGGKGGSGPGSARSSGTINAGGTTKSATAFGAGGGAAVAIPAGMPFAGRQAGGGTRGEVYGNKQYGSGYPNEPSRGVAGRGFPFYFWPVPWIGAAGVGGGAYLYRNDFSGSNNSSRPGGLMMSAPFTSASQSNTFWVLADNETTRSLVEDIRDACSDLLDKTDTVLTPYGENFTTPKPEQVVQYYRASSVALALEGYNNTAIFEAEGTPDVPLPSDTDTSLLDCLNNTIGEAVPLVDAAFSVRWSAAPSSMGLVGMAYVVWSLSSLI